MTDHSSGLKVTPARELKKKQRSTQQAPSQTGTQQKTCSPSRLEKAISELQGLNELLLSGDLDPRILEDFRDALNRVRTSAWAAQQYVALRETDQGSSSILAFLVAERIRAAYQLCQAISNDLKRPDIEVQPGSLVRLYEVMNALTGQLKGVVDSLG